MPRPPDRYRLTAPPQTVLCEYRSAKTAAFDAARANSICGVQELSGSGRIVYIINCDGYVSRDFITNETGTIKVAQPF